MTKRKKDYPWEKNYPEGVEWDIEIPAVPLYKILDDAVAKFPESVCIDYYGKLYSYEEIGDEVNRLAKGLQRMRLPKGIKIGLLMPNCPQFLIAYYAILKIGAVVVNYNPLYTINEIGNQVIDSDTRLMITLNMTVLCEKTSNLLQTTCLEKVIIASLQDSLPFPKNVLFGILKKSEMASIAFGRVNVSYETLIENDGKYKEVEIKPKEDLAVLQYTGGTTGLPKGAMLTHYNLYANTIQSGIWFHELEEGEERMMGVLPFFHVFAMTVVMNLSVHKACRIIMHSRFDIGQILKDVQKKKATLLPGVPTLFTAINNFKKIDKYDLTSLKACLCGGAPLPLEVKERFEEMSGCALVEGYGLTESSPVVAANPMFSEGKPGSIGLPFPGTVIEIRSTEGRRPLMPKDKVGEICITGPQVMKGYFASDDTNDVIRSGRLHTGDLGYMDKDGYIFVVDRIKEMIISSGFNVYPREIEEVIYKHPDVEEAAVIGVDDQYRGQLVKAFVKLKDGRELEEKELKEFLKGKLVKYKLPSVIEFRDELPKTLIGKISKKDLVG